MDYGDDKERQTRPVCFWVFMLLILALLLALTAQSCSVSMEEPFDNISMYLLIWQIILPTFTATSSVYLIIEVIRQRISFSHRFVIILLTIILILIFIASVENGYGYIWDLMHHGKMPESVHS